MGMDNVIFVLGGCALFFGSIYFVVKVAEWILEWRKKQYKTQESEFMRDLYRIQIKWAKRGCVEYSEAIGMIIRSYNPVEIQTAIQTEYAKHLNKASSQNG